ncbi:MAG TPA: hypothetical protein VES42_14025 [Pilimelia sp.]|nr:hypothetical protein [Pilimelia sp.]
MRAWWQSLGRAAKGVIAVLAGALIAAIVGPPGAEVGRRITWFAEEPQPAVTVARTPHALESGWIVPAERSDIPRLVRGQGDDVADERRWQARTGAVRAAPQAVHVNIAATDPAGIVLERLDVKVHGCRAAVAGVHAVRPGAGPPPPLYVQIVVDETPVRVAAYAKPRSAAPIDLPEPVVMPLPVTGNDIQRLEIVVESLRRDCEWSGRLYWSAPGDRQPRPPVVIDDGGQPFRVTATVAKTDTMSTFV